MDVPQKIKNKSTTRSNNSTSHAKEMKTGFGRDTCIPVFINSIIHNSYVTITILNSYGNNPNTHSQMDGKKECSAYTQWNIIQP